MLNKIAKFHKVSYEQFETDFCSKYGSFSYPQEVIYSFYVLSGTAAELNFS